MSILNSSLVEIARSTAVQLSPIGETSCETFAEFYLVNNPALAEEAVEIDENPWT